MAPSGGVDSEQKHLRAGTHVATEEIAVLLFSELLSFAESKLVCLPPNPPQSLPPLPWVSSVGHGMVGSNPLCQRPLVSRSSKRGWGGRAQELTCKSPVKDNELGEGAERLPRPSGRNRPMGSLQTLRPLWLAGADQSEVGAKSLEREGKGREQGSPQPPRVGASSKWT